MRGFFIHFWQLTVRRRGLDDLPQLERIALSECVPKSVDVAELNRIFRVTMKMLMTEVSIVDPGLSD